MTKNHSGEETHSANKRGAPGGIISLQGGGIIQESLGAIIPLQTGGFIGFGTSRQVHEVVDK